MKPAIGLGCTSGAAATTTTDPVSGAKSTAENGDCADAMFDTDTTKLPRTTERYIDSPLPFHSTPRVKSQRHNRLVNCRKPRSFMVNDRFLRCARNSALMPVPVITDAEMQGTGRATQSISYQADGRSRSRLRSGQPARRCQRLSSTAGDRTGHYARARCDQICA